MDVGGLGFKNCVWIEPALCTGIVACHDNVKSLRVHMYPHVPGQYTLEPHN